MSNNQRDKLIKDLNSIQIRFCELLVADKSENATDAYRGAGFKAKGKAIETGASRLLRNAKIAAYVQYLRDERSKRTNVDADWVFKKLTKLTEICMAEVPVMVKVKGVLIPTGEYRVDSFGANKAIETISKCLGMFKEKGETPATPIVNNINVGIDLGKYSSEQIRQKIGELVTTSVNSGSNRLIRK